MSHNNHNQRRWRAVPGGDRAIRARRSHDREASACEQEGGGGGRGHRDGVVLRAQEALAVRIDDEMGEKGELVGDTDSLLLFAFFE